MTLLRRCFPHIPARQEGSAVLVVCLLFGAGLGAVCAKLCVSFASDALHGLDFERCGSLPPLRLLFHYTIFPISLFTAAFLRARTLFLLFTVLKGFFVSCLLCTAAALGGAALRTAAPSVLCLVILPLPVILSAASVWLDGMRRSQANAWLLIPVSLVGAVGVLLRSLLF